MAPELPELLSYRIKKVLLGQPLVSEQLATERLGTFMALGVLSPDAISSSAYGTEEMLVELVRIVGVASFALVLPITFALLLVLTFVTLSYREVVMVYTRAGGSYVVARDNFGPTVAQVAAVALLIDYTVTVAVQTAAGTDALVSAFPKLLSVNVPRPRRPPPGPHHQRGRRAHHRLWQPARRYARRGASSPSRRTSSSSPWAA